MQDVGAFQIRPVVDAERVEHRALVIEVVAEPVIEPARDGARDLLVLDERLIQPRALVPGEQGIEQRQREEVRRHARRQVIAERNGRRLRELVFLRRSLFPVLRRLADVGRRRQRARLNAAKMLFGELHHLVRLRVADDDEHGVVRRVVRIEEILHVVERRRLDLLQIAVEVVGVIPVRVGLLVEIEPLEAAVRLVQHVDADFLAHDVLLVLQVLGRDFERPHAVGFEPHGGLERVRGHDLEIIRVIEARRPVQDAAVLVDDTDVLEFAHVLGSLEHHVLEQMREACAILRLDPESDAVHDLDRHDRRGMVFADDDAKAVRQLVIDDGNRKAAAVGGLCRGRDAGGRQQPEYSEHRTHGHR